MKGFTNFNGVLQNIKSSFVQSPIVHMFSLHDFSKIKDLGTGRYGKVILARDRKTGFLCAIKQMSKKLMK